LGSQKITLKFAVVLLLVLKILMIVKNLKTLSTETRGPTSCTGESGDQHWLKTVNKSHASVKKTVRIKTIHEQPKL